MSIDERSESSASHLPALGALRRAVFWVVVAAATLVLVASAVETFTADPHEGEGWVGGLIEAVFAGGPLVLVAVGLRSRRRTTARRTAVASVVLASVVAFVLTMQVLDPNETTADRVVQAVAFVVYLAAFAVELPAFGRQWPADPMHHRESAR